MFYLMSDIHGDYQNFYKMLVKINFSPSDILYILGDVIDKGDDNLCLFDFIRCSENIILIKGNHEFLFERYLRGTISAEFWDACGGESTRREADRLPKEKKEQFLEYLTGLPVYKILTIKGCQYFLTHSGYYADFAVPDLENGRIDIKKSVDYGAAADQEKYLISNDIHNIPDSLKFNMKIVVGHYPVVFLPGHEKAVIYHGENYMDIDTWNERRDKGGRLSCFRLDDGKEFYV